jgi:hypothetical protein
VLDKGRTGFPVEPAGNIGIPHRMKRHREALPEASRKWVYPKSGVDVMVGEIENIHKKVLEEKGK